MAEKMKGMVIVTPALLPPLLWKPKHTLKEEIAKTFGWFKDNQRRHS